MPHEPVTKRTELEHVLRETRNGVLATVGKDGQPYVTPLNHFYHAGKLYFHCARQGRKLDNIAVNSNVCFTAYESGEFVFGNKACDCAQRYVCVICFGTARVIEDVDDKTDILVRLTAHYSGREYDMPSPVRINGTTVVEITITHMTGKRNVESLKVPAE